MKNLLTLIVILGFSLNVNSQSENALWLNGTSDYLNVSQNTTLNLTDTISVEAWVRPVDNPLSQTIISKSWCSGNNYSWKLSSTEGKFRWHWNSGGNCNNTNWYESDSAFTTPNECLHIAVVHTPFSVQLYVNGDSISGSITLNNTGYGSIQSTSTDLRIGASMFLNQEIGDFFEGAIDEVRIWNYALSQNDIVERNELQLSGSETGLVLLMDMEVTGSGDGLIIPNQALSTGSVNDGIGIGTDYTPSIQNRCVQITSLPENNTFHGIIYPNPVNDNVFFIEIKDAKKTLLELIDYNGKVILSRQLLNNRSMIDLSMNSKGLYLIRLINEDKVSIAKLIIE